MAGEQKIMRRVVRTVEEGMLLHFYLSCGHIITMHKADIKKSPAPTIECWACEEESKKTKS